MNANFVKIPESYRKKTIEYLKSKHSVQVSPHLMEEQDFIITPHLISGQFIVYSFLNFSPYSRLIFKYPSHKKKLHQFLQGQVSRFETQQKGKRKVFIQNDIRDIFLGLLSEALSKNPSIYVVLKASDIKNNPDRYMDSIDKLSHTHSDEYQFPIKYL